MDSYMKQASSLKANIMYTDMCTSVQIYTLFTIAVSDGKWTSTKTLFVQGKNWYDSSPCFDNSCIVESNHGFILHIPDGC